ncbi:alanine racemase [Oryzomicrobium sp.]|uniref:alanine racemase n=1 Tax=Oryzomicrobium sp. TaxID=1911578 RepID=UPI0025FFCED8|nr:alanine racemase [Oryzomicrobium sp.]MCE1242392.1 alanine racemase [Oryzomicrobium sp.]
MSRPIRARIDLAALRHNFAVARRYAGTTRLFSVVKANAYGHGLLPCAQALAGLTDGYALLDLADAVALREAGIRQPILLLEGYFDAEELPILAEYGITPALHRADQLEEIELAGLPRRLDVFLKVNSGMNRLGFTGDALTAAVRRATASPAFADVTLMTHFADADGPRGVAWQLDRFHTMLPCWAGPVSLANSAALLRYPETRGDWARPGIMLYGGSPFADIPAEQLELKPVMTLASQIIGVQEIGPGERVGYGGTFTADRPTRVGIVACGYADGYPRHAGTGAPILVDGRRTRLLGRVSMDMLACDLTGLPDSGVGSPVTLWGEGLSADDVATAAGTISYELFCALARRVPVDFVDGEAGGRGGRETD